MNLQPVFHIMQFSSLGEFALTSHFLICLPSYSVGSTNERFYGGDCDKESGSGATQGNVR